jgi:hypothetical protein
MKPDFYKEYLLTDSEKFAKDAMDKAQYEHKIDEGDIQEISDEISLVVLDTGHGDNTEKYKLQCRYLEGVVPTLGLIFPKPEGAKFLSHCIGNDIHLAWSFSLEEDYTWELLRSPSLSREKMLDCDGYDYARICYSLLLNPQLWYKAKSDDASWMFRSSDNFQD